MRAVSLDRPPLPQLSPGAWQMKERGIEVGRVAAWYEVKARAAEVAHLARDLAGQVRDWLDRTADRVLDRLGAERPEPALAGGREDQDREQSDLATRLRQAWESRQGQDRPQEAVEREHEAPQDLAARLRAAAAGIDQQAFTGRAAELRESREVEERQQAREVELAQERERQRELETKREREGLSHDRGYGRGR